MFAPLSVPIVPPLTTVKVLLLVAVLEFSSVSVPPLATWMGTLLAEPLIWRMTGLTKALTLRVYPPPRLTLAVSPAPVCPGKPPPQPLHLVVSFQFVVGWVEVRVQV